MSQLPNDQIPDETLMAYADGELDPAERTAVEAYVNMDAAAAARLAAFSRSGRTLGRLYDQPMHEPVPTRLLMTVVESGRTPRSLAGQFAGLFALPAWLPAPAAFAGVLLTVCALGWSAAVLRGDAVGPQLQADAHLQGLFAGTGLREALETAPSGVPPTLAATTDAGSVTPVLSFVSKSGNYCRQYAITDGTGARFSGVSCRAANGDWRIEAYMPAPATPNTSGKTAPAAGADVRVVEHLIDGMITGDAFVGEQEAKLIANRWRNAQ